MIEVQNVSIVYGTGQEAIPLWKKFHFPWRKGRWWRWWGPSGCGKTSLLLAIDGLIRPTSGRILIAGEEVQGVRRDVALILQDAGLLPWKTVRANAELALRIQKKAGKR
jgi:ABC-type nitrate/sulfonate/bicarbonate transport system ATPase subunit